MNNDAARKTIRSLVARRAHAGRKLACLSGRCAPEYLAAQQALLAELDRQIAAARATT